MRRGRGADASTDGIDVGIVIPPPRRSRAQADGSWETVAGCLSLFLLVGLGLVFTFFDLVLGVASSTSAVLAVLVLGFLLASPFFLGGRKSVRRMMLAVAIFGMFASWIVGLKRVEWDETTPFHRAHQRIRAGMTQEEVEAVVGAEFAGRKPPQGTWDAQHGHYVLDPDDGRFNAEIIVIQMFNGRVVSAEYHPD